MATRLFIFWGLFIGLGLLQLVRPGKPFYKGRSRVFVSNLLLVIFNNIVLFILPIIPMSTATYAEGKSMGLLHLIALPSWSEVVIGLLLLDMIIYWQHRIFHQSNFLWRFHRMHHMDPLLDVSSGLRFHPIEIIISNFIKVIAVVLLGINVSTVIIFEIALNGFAMFNHSNLGLSIGLEKFLKPLAITPAKHNIHHSILRWETNSNYGFSVPWWDMIFGSYKASGTKSMAEMKLGIPGNYAPELVEFPKMLLVPFVKL